MLQLTDVDAEILAIPSPSGPSLELAAEAAVEGLRTERTRRAGARGGHRALLERLDRALRTDRTELIDRPDVFR